MPSIAFFDVDGTLWSELSLVSFYRFLLESRHPRDWEARWERFSHEAAARRASGAPREALNAWFYENHFAGLEVNVAASVGRRWFDRHATQPGFLVAPAVQAARAHRASGDLVVLVSGSFREVVAPLGELLEASAALLAPLEEVDGRYTGRLTGAPMIGAGKAGAVGAYLRACGVDAGACFGYGDDESDVPFLEQLGEPRVVAARGSAVATNALERGWRVLELPDVSREERSRP